MKTYQLYKISNIENLSGWELLGTTENFDVAMSVLDFYYENGNNIAIFSHDGLEVTTWERQN